MSDKLKWIYLHTYQSRHVDNYCDKLPTGELTAVRKYKSEQEAQTLFKEMLDKYETQAKRTAVNARQPSKNNLFLQIHELAKISGKIEFIKQELLCLDEGEDNENTKD